MVRIKIAVAASALVLSCSAPPDLAVRGGWTRLELGGDVALAPSSGAATASIDVRDQLGLEAEGTPWVGAALDGPIGRVEVSAMRYESEGDGRLDASFGDIAAGTPVESEAKVDNLKATWTFDVVDTGMFRLAPGIGVDWFDIDTTVRSVTPVSVFERIEISAPLPLAVLEAAVELGAVTLELQAGGMHLDAGDIDGTYFDLGSRLVVTPTEGVELFVGYRYLSIEAAGRADGQPYDADLAMDGILVGGGVRF